MSIETDEIKRASWVGIGGNAFLAILKIVIGLVAGSLAVVADGIDSSSDILTSVITLITARIMAKPPNIHFPYGYAKADTIATKGLSFIIFFAGAQLMITSIRKLLVGGPSEIPSLIAIFVTMFSIAAKLLLARYQFRIGKKVQSAMLIANGKNMQNDVIISSSVLVGLFFTQILKLPVIDTIAALAVSVWILKVAFEIFMQTNTDLMDGIKDSSIYNKIFDVIDTVPGVKNPHRVRVRKIGSQLMVAIDIEIDGNLSLYEAHHLSHNVEKSLKEKIDNVFDVAIHIEPIGDNTQEKDVGLSRDTI
jgi:cation diffusion facilitator family transporter